MITRRELPLLQREIKAFGVRPSFFLVRCIPGVIALSIFLIAMLFVDVAPGSIILDAVGSYVGNACLLFQYGIALLGAPIWAAEIVGREREERTLPLLLLADFRGGDILLAKFAGAYGPAVLLCLGTGPLLILSAIGRISVLALTFATAHSIAVAALGVSMGIFWSIRTGSRNRGARAAVMTMAGYALLTVYVSTWNGSVNGRFPFYAWHEMSFLNFSPIAPFVSVIAAPLLLACLTLASSYPYLLRATEPRRLNEYRKSRAWIRGAVDPARQERRLLEQIMAGDETNLRSRVMKAIYFMLLAGVSAVPFWGNGAVAVLLAYHLCVRNGRLINSTMIDDLRLTHAEDDAFGQRLRNVMTSGFLWRTVFFLGTFWLIGIVMLDLLLRDPNEFLQLQAEEVATGFFIVALILLGAVTQSLMLHALAAVFTTASLSRGAQIGLTILAYFVAKAVSYGCAALTIIAISSSDYGPTGAGGFFGMAILIAAVTIAPLGFTAVIAFSAIPGNLAARFRHDLVNR